MFYKRKIIKTYSKLKDLINTLLTSLIREVTAVGECQWTVQITDFYDYDNWKFSEKDSIKSRYIKILNNSAYIQQKSGELVPYVLYIPITIMQNEFEDIIKNGAKNF